MTTQRNNTTSTTPSPFRAEGRGEGLTVGFALIVMLLLTSALRADTIVLRDGPAIRSTTVLLGDIADLEGPLAIALADVPLGSLTTAGNRTFTLAEIRAALDARDIHWGKIDLRGPTRLTVTRLTLNKTKTVDGAANPIAAIDAQAPAPTTAPTPGSTLRQLITALVQQRAGRSDDALRITPLEPDAAAWSLTDADYRFEIEPAARQTLGRIPFNIRCYKHDQLDSVRHVSVDVALQSKVVITTRQIQRGQIIVPADLSAKTQWLDTDRIQPLPDPSACVGQATTRLLRAGTILAADDIAPRTLVERGQLVSVRASTGNVIVKFTARASDSGAAGDTIEVRNPRTREAYTVRVIGPQETEMQIAPGTSNAPHADAKPDDSTVTAKVDAP